tara:strand:+ start:374141 stop:374599 length:459 start_codon:yes stop_codon:yes gene_type:complete
MNKKISYLIIFFQLVLMSCGSSKVATTTISNKTKLESYFRNYKGTKYQFGGTDKNGFDCSGFTQVMYKNAFNIQLPRTTELQGELGKKVSKNKLRPGDLVFFRPSRKYRHVGIFIGDGMFIHSSTSKGVIKSSMNNVYWKKKYRYAKRILKR